MNRPEVVVLQVPGTSAQALLEQCQRRARMLERASRRQALVGDAVGAVLFAWGADLSMMQCVLIQRLIVDARAPQREYFAAIAALAAALSDDQQEVPSADALLSAVREEVFAAVDADVATAIAGQLPDITYLAGMSAPESQQMHEFAARRLHGLTPQAFIDARRQEADRLMVQAQSTRMRGSEESAIRQAYDSDFRSLEAYLVESAVAAGDGDLLTVELRWELAVQAIGEVSALPVDFAAAVAMVRDALAAGLGEPDATRLRMALPQA